VIAVLSELNQVCISYVYNPIQELNVVAYQQNLTTKSAAPAGPFAIVGILVIVLFN